MAKILELENYVKRPAYETAYKFVVKDRELLWEVAQHLTGDKDFANSRVSIGVGNFPSFYVDGEQGFYFKLMPSLLFYGGLTDEKLQKLESLVKKHISPKINLVGYSEKDRNFFWDGLEIINEREEIISQADENHFTYQFDDILSSNQRQFLGELEEALKIQQIILSTLPFPQKGTLILGNPYLYSGGRLWLNALHHPKPEAIAKFRKMTDDYLMERLPDIEEARKVFSGVIPQLYASEQEIKRLNEENAKLRPKRRTRASRLSKFHRFFAESETESKIERSCQTIGIDYNVFSTMPYEQARKFLDSQRKTWARIYHSQGHFDERIKDINEAVDFLEKDLSKIQ